MALARFGVQHVIILSSTPLLELYEDPLGRLQVTKLCSASWESQGDALRDLETRTSLRPVDDFIIVHPNAVFNINLAELVTAHKSRKQADPNWLVTTVFRKTAGIVRTGLTVAIDASTHTLVKYSTSVNDDGLSLDVAGEHANLQSGARVDIFHDVLDIGLDVCSPEFLLEFRENFYFSRIRSYIEEKLDGGEADVLGNRVFVHFVDSRRSEFATRVNNLAMLAQATSDILNGWMAPVVSPQSDTSTPAFASDGSEQVTYVPDRTIFGQDVGIGIGATITECAIGHHVTIGNDATLSQCIIGDGCIIGDSCVLNRCILDKDCRIQSDCVLPSRCFIDKDVHVGVEQLPIDSHSLITTRDPAAFHVDSDDSEDDDANDWFDTHDSCVTDGARDHSKAPASTSEKTPAKLFELKAPEVGDERGASTAMPQPMDVSADQEKGTQLTDEGSFVHENGTMDDDLDDSEIVVKGDESTQDNDGDADNVPDFVVNGTVISGANARSIDAFFYDRPPEQEYFSDSVDELESESDEDEEEDEEPSTQSKTTKSFADGDKGGVSLNGVGSEDVSKSLASLSLHDRQLDGFTREVLETIERSFDEEVDIENTDLELKGLKLSYDCSFTETLSRVLAAVTLSLSRRMRGDALYGGMVKAVHKYKPILEKYTVKDDAQHDKQIVRDIANIVGSEKATAVMYMFKVLYDKDLVDEEGILAWGKEERTRVELGQSSPQMSNTLQPFLDWLEEDDDDDDDEDDDDE